MGFRGNKLFCPSETLLGQWDKTCTAIYSVPDSEPGSKSHGISIMFGSPALNLESVAILIFKVL